MLLTTTRLHVGFWAIWLLLLIFCYFNSSDDPSSIFYDPSHAYEQRYSLSRAAEAHDYLQRFPEKLAPSMREDKFLCIGIPSVNRTSANFLAYTIATLTDKLSREERAATHLVVLLAEKNPESHFGYRQPWLEGIADEVLIYGDPPSNHSVYRKVPYNLYGGRTRGDGRVENMRLDHSALVERCREYGSPYFALVEDDIIASPKWLRRLRSGLEYAEKQATKSSKDWIYLRLFYSEVFMGWNNEEWLTYSRNIFLVYTAVLLAFLATLGNRRCRPSRRPTTLTPIHVALVLGLWMPALIALYFLAGRISVSRLNPFTWTWHGVREMPRYGCCAQGLVFAQRHLQGLQDLLRNPPYAFAGDQILEDYAGARHLAKWALDPSVFQHAGSTESSTGGPRNEVWNFSFERQNYR